jgi:ketosteroid isomerase-like protein
MRKALFLVSVLMLTLPAAAQTEQQKAEIENDILAVMTVQASAWNRGDIDSFMLGYWKSEKLVFASGDNITRGWQSTLDRYKKTYDSKAKMGELAFTGLEITVLSRDAAVVLGSWSLKRESDNPKGKFTLIFRRVKEGWRIVHDHTS